MVGNFKVLYVGFRFDAEDGPLSVSYADFCSGTRKFDAGKDVRWCFDDEDKAWRVFVDREDRDAPVFKVLGFRFLGLSINAIHTEVVGRVVSVKRFFRVVDRYGKRMVTTKIVPAKVVGNEMISIG